MLSVDTNIILYAINSGCNEFPSARAFMDELAERDDVVICELVLVELYMLLRNRAVVGRPLGAQAAVDVCVALRRNPRWMIAESGPVMEDVWKLAAAPSFARRRIVDARLALTLRHHGVTELATHNHRDFQGFGFDRVWSPIG